MITIKLKRGNSARWAELDLVLEDGEPGFDLDTGILKIGNGVSRWSQLPPIGPVQEAQVEQIVSDYLAENPPASAGLNTVGAGQFVILEHDADASLVPDGTFIARLPQGWAP